VFKRQPKDPPPLPVPGTLNSLREQPRHPGRYMIEIGNVPVGPLSAESIGALGLAKGREVDEALLLRVVAAARAVACYDKAVAALARRARPRADLERWLRQREFGGEEIAPALDKLTELGLLDDLAFARSYAASRTVGRGFGRRRVAAELARKGVPRPIVDQVLGDLAEELETSEPEAMEAAAEKRARSLRALEPEVAQRRLFGWLVRRGCDARLASDLARRLLPR